MDQFGHLPITEEELDVVRNQIKSRRELLDSARVFQLYKDVGLPVLASPFDRGILDTIIQALRTKTPFSHVRIGDGEVSFLAYGDDKRTLNLDRMALERTVMSFQDRFRLTEHWALFLKSSMHAAINSADTIGVLGMWRAREVAVEVLENHLVDGISGDPRGLSGHWRAIQVMLDFVQSGALRPKLICSAHSYFGLVRRLDELLDAAEDIVCITSCKQAVDNIANRTDARSVLHIPLPTSPVSGEALPETPEFLDRVREQLPKDLTGHLVLIGAGAWAEFYCSWAKERGGIAVDIGSGFNLLQGEVVRPIQRRYLEDNNLSAKDFTNGSFSSE